MSIEKLFPVSRKQIDQLNEDPSCLPKGLTPEQVTVILETMTSPNRTDDGKELLGYVDDRRYPTMIHPDIQTIKRVVGKPVIVSPIFRDGPGIHRTNPNSDPTNESPIYAEVVPFTFTNTNSLTDTDLGLYIEIEKI